MGKIQSIRGMHDALPEQVRAWRLIEERAGALLDAYGYQEIRLPILEKTELFKRSIGDVTDIVEKEMYTFEDAGGDILSLRPEGTASCVRACLQHGLIGKGQQQRFWYSGPFFRRERPQKGRYRQFYQIGAEAFGFEGPDIDAELIILVHSLLNDRLLFEGVWSIEINTLGNTESRVRYREVLIDYLRQHENELDENARRRMLSNPLRVLDSKDAATQAVARGAPLIGDYLDNASRQHFDQLQTLLRQAGVPFNVNPRLVRGLDYYSHTIFELVFAEPEAGSTYTLCAGGRYDGLAEMLGGQPVPAAGFAIGIDRLALQSKDLLIPQLADIYVVAVGTQAEGFVHGFVKKLRQQMYEDEKARLMALRKKRKTRLKKGDIHEQAKREPCIIVNAGGGKMTTQLKRANKAGASIALIFGEDEMAKQEATVKFMREEREQECVSVADIPSFCKKLIDDWL